MQKSSGYYASSISNLLLLGRREHLSSLGDLFQACPVVRSTSLSTQPAGLIFVVVKI
jgi:hypothetical protein